MAKFQPGAVTTAGRALLAKVQAGEQSMVFTKCEIGSGTYTDGEDITSCTALKETQQTYGISGAEHVSADTSQITVIASNASVTTGFTITEVGIFAKDGDSEILYALMVVYPDQGDYMAPNDSGNPSSILYRCMIAVGNASSVTVQNTETAYAAAEDLAALEKKVTEIKATCDARAARDDRVVEVTLTASGWSAAVPYSQTATVSGMKSTDHPIISPALASGTDAAAAKSCKKMTGMIDGADTADDSITFWCLNKRPSADFTVRLTGVSNG